MTEHDLLLRPLLALVAGGLVGLERSFHGRAAGLRTYALVSFASALLVGVAQSLSPAPGDGNINVARVIQGIVTGIGLDRKSTRLNSSHMSISYAVFCLKKKKRELAVRGTTHN